ncbi:MAG: hypothetical protein GC178_05845, partial [Flavobacteriales bacterium]|nr:hypothetical protein [Flavobacteriales bacterium]
MRKQYFPTVLKSILFVAIMAMQSFSASATCNAHIDNLVIHDLGNNSNTTIVDGATYSLGSLPTNWNVEAIVSGTTIGSVKFTWSGDYSSTNTENAYPYRSPSDAGALNFGAGSYTLTVKVYYEGGCGGSLCDETTIHFTISGCDNVTDPGEIGYAQSECSSFDPTEIVSVHDPSGGSGNLEFVWLKSYDGGSTYSVITGANGLTYDPGVITQTTWFRRCSRRAGCTSYVGESNWVKMAIDPQACFVPIQGELCFNGNDETIVNAQSRWVSQWSTDIDAGTLTVRTTLAKTFVDNTYGTNAVQWPGNGHSFSQLVGSDKLQIALYDNNDNKKMEFKMDYITSTNSAPSGYKTLGVTGGDGGMLTGNASDVVGVKTSLSENFNTYGYVLTTNSPATDNDYTPNPSYPNWDFDVWYEATVKLDVFGSAGFGYPDITAVHASPSKTGHNSEDVTPVPCDNCAGVTISVNASATDVSCNADTIGQCQAVDYQNGSHAIWINTLPNTGQYFRFENGSGSLVEYPDGTAHITGIIYNTVETNKRWQVDVYLNDKMNWTQWQAAGGSWKGTASIVGNNYLDWAYYEMDASQSKLIGLDYYAGKVLNLQRMAAAPQFRVQVGTAANDKNGNYGLSLWYDYSGSFCSSGHGDFNFDLQNCSSQGCDGTATAVASGGTAPYTYSWDNGGSSSTLDGLCAGQYCVTVTDANGCTSDAVCVTVGQQGPCCDNVTDAGQIGVDQSNCGEFDVAELTNISAPSGGTGDLEIVWITRPGTSGTWQMIAGASGLSYDPGVVSVTTQFRRCARRAGCTDYVGESNIITITINPSFTLDCNSSDASAWEASDGTVGVIVNGGTGPFTYLWNTGATTASISNVPAGVYSVTVTDANGCEQWTECCVKQPPVPTVCIGFRTQTQGGWGAVPHGGNPGTYLHDNFSTAFPSGIEIGCNNKFRFTSAQAITDFLPCGGTATSLPSGIATDPACPGNVLAGQVLAATISVGFDNAIPSYSTSTVPLENLIVRYGTFQGWTVGDLLAEANRKLGGCSSSYSYSQLNDAVTAVNENYDDGNVTGNYLDCCTLTASATSTDVTCDTATSHVCEVIPYENGSHAVWFNSLSTGSAYYKFVDGHGTLVEYPDGTAHYSGTVYNTSDNNKKWLVDINLENKKNWTQWSATGGQWKGTASIVGSNYLNWSYYEFAAGSKMVGLGDWAGKELTITQNSNAPQYAVQVGVAANDKNGNYGLSAWFNFVGSGESGHGDFNFDIQNCTDGSCNGTATASAAGGSAPYTYLWDNGATTASLSGLCAGQYCVTVVDATGCKADACVTVGDRPACCNANEPGQIEGSQESCGAFDPETFQSLNPASGGLGDLEYQWYSKTTETSWIPIQGATGETYDAPYTSETTQFKRCARRSGCPEFNVCSNVLEITIHPNNIVATCSSTPAGCNGVASGSVSVYVQGGTSPYAYIWSNGATSTSLNGLAAGTYSVTVTDANGCSTSCQAAVSEPASISVTCTKVDGTCSNNNEGSVSASVSGGTAPFTYSWSNGSTASSISGLAGGTYSVTVTDANGCSATCSKSVSITPCCNVTNGGQIAGGGSHCGPFDPDPITSASLPTGGLGDLEYVWLWNTEDVPNYGNNGWVMIPNSNSPTYDPGMLTESRCFLRCARRSGCATYVGESNRICFTINPEPTANCSKVDGTCAN